MSSTAAKKHISAADPQFGEDVKPNGAGAQMGEVPPNNPPLDPATKEVLKDRDRAAPPPIVPDDEE